MKISGLWPVFLLASLVCGSAQVTVEVTQDQHQFLPGESLKVAVRITNLSGRQLHLGGEEDWLTFAVESRDGKIVPKIGEAPVLGEFVLDSSKVAIKRADLGPYFALSQPGSYQIVATVRIHEWGRELTSEPRPFDVLHGTKIWEQDVGVPGSTNAEPEIRRYILQQANYLRGQIRLYLRITDFYGKPFRVFALGQTVSFGRPEPQVDRLSNLHVMFQDGASAFTYVACNLQGELIARRSYDYVDSRPRLRIDDDGNVSVMGGVRRITSADVPPQNDETNTPAAILPPLRPQLPTNQLSVTKPPR